MPTSRLSGPARRLLAVQTLFQLAVSLAGVFVNIFLWQTSALRAVTIYNIYFFVTIPVFFAVAGVLVKAQRRSWGFTLGAVLYSAFYSLLLAWGAAAAHHLAFLGILAGMAAGFSWINLHTLAFDLIPREQRDYYYGLNGSLNTVATLLGPLVAGYIIYRLGNPAGYRVVFGFAVVVFLTEAVLSLGLASAGGGQRLDWKVVFSRRVVPGWPRTLAAHLVVGSRDGVLMVLTPILIYSIGGNALAFGRLNSLFALLMSVAYFLAGRLIRLDNRRPFFVLGAWGSFLAPVALSLLAGVPGVVVFNVLNSIFPVFWNVPYSSQYFDIVQMAPHSADRRVEFILVREICLNLGRVTSAGAFLLAGSSLSGPGLRLLLPLAIAPMLLLPRLMAPAARSASPAEATAA
ncbi:MAG: MFS transporter [Symbiobacteriia bacterium]